MKRLIFVWGGLIIMMPVLAQRGADRGKITDIVDIDTEPSSLGMGGVIFLIILCLVALLYLSYIQKKNKDK